MIAVVCPSNRPESLERWQREWKSEFDRPDVRVYVVRDEPSTWTEIADTLGDRAWVIPRQTDCIRSWGFLRAYRDGASAIISLDDDCYPETARFVDAHENRLAGRMHEHKWASTILPLQPRGLPKNQWSSFPIMINHGLWTNVPDLDAETQLATPAPFNYGAAVDVVEQAVYYPMSGMNVAFRREMVPAMWFTLMGSHITDGEPWGMDRYGDIWAGVLSKKVADHLGYCVRSGAPWVRHDRASNPHVNLVKERVAKAANEWFWERVDRVRLTQETVAGAYDELAALIDLPDEPYWNSFKLGMRTWVRLVND